MVFCQPAFRGMKTQGYGPGKMITFILLFNGVFILCISMHRVVWRRTLQQIGLRTHQRLPLLRSPSLGGWLAFQEFIRTAGLNFDIDSATDTMRLHLEDKPRSVGAPRPGSALEPQTKAQAKAEEANTPMTHIWMRSRPPSRGDAPQAAAPLCPAAEGRRRGGRPGGRRGGRALLLQVPSSDHPPVTTMK